MKWIVSLFIVFQFGALGTVYAGGFTASNEFTEGRDTNSVQAVQSLEAYAKYKMGQYQEAREIWLKLAEKNNTSALINLANIYEEGQGVKRDLKQSIAWLRKAAKLGDSRGQYQLAMAYEKNMGVERDLMQAAKWFEKAAVQGDGNAQFSIGVLLATNYGKGLATSSNDQRKEASKWLALAKEKDIEDATGFLTLLTSMKNQ
ncbi:MAG: sel1 repeat family protein [Cycloclasticus sp.]|nr:sel1 repeat family protein [Cycloclasticus sp.]